MRLAEAERHFILGAHLVFLLLITGAMPVATLSGQEPHVQETAPPLMKTISRAERTQLNEAKDSKARLRTTLELADAHLGNAETQTSLHDYDAAATEAGKYWALVEDTLDFLKTLSRDSNKTRDLYKRLELTLRADGPRLNAIRRGTPSEYAVRIKEVEEYARKGRTEALNSFYGHTVVRDPSDQQQSSKPPKSVTPE